MLYIYIDLFSYLRLTLIVGSLYFKFKLLNNFSSHKLKLSIIDAYAQTGTVRGAQRANELLQEMEEVLFSNNNDITNDYKNENSRTIALNTVMNAWANTKEPNVSGHNSEKHLSQMEHLYYSEYKFYRPDKISFHTIMNAYSKEQHSGFNTERILRHIWQKSFNIIPDTTSYNIVIDAYV